MSSLSLEFSQEQQQPPVRAVELAQQPQDIDDDVLILESDDWKIWKQNAGQYLWIHKKVQGMPDAISLGPFAAELIRNPVNSRDTICLGVQIQAGKMSKKFRTVPIDWLVDAIVRGDVIYAHEVFIETRGSKLFMDIDARKDQLLNEFGSVERFLRLLFNEVAQKLGFSNDPFDWTVLQCGYEEKFSFHVILNDGTWFQNNTAIKRVLTEAGFDTGRFFIDMAVYNSRAGLRIPFGSKWETGKAPNPFLIAQVGSSTLPPDVRGLGISHTQVTPGILRACLAQCEPDLPRLVRVEGLSQEIEDAATRAVETTTNNGHIDKFLAWYQALDRHRNVRLDVTEIQNLGDGLVSFRIDNALGWGYTYAPVKVILNSKNDTARIIPDGDGESLVGFSRRTEPMAKAYRFLDFLKRHYLDRPDLPIFPGWTFGHFDMTVGEFFDMVRKTRNCDCTDCKNEGIPEFFCSMPLDMTSDMLMSLEFFNFIRTVYGGENQNFEMCTAYWNLFIATVASRNATYFRTPNGLSVVSETQLKKLVAAYEYTRMKTVGKKEFEESRPFYEVFVKHCRIWSGTSTDFSFAPRSPLNVNMPKAIDTEAALLAFENCSPATRGFLQAFYISFLRQFLCDEPRETWDDLEIWFTRWMGTCMFDIRHRLELMVLIRSVHQGQGKSTVGKIIRRCLGSNNSTSRPMDLFLKERFTQGTNCFVEAGEIEQLSTLEEAKLRDLLTADTMRSEGKGQNQETLPNHRRWFGTSNAKMPLRLVNKDRRYFVLEPPSVSRIDDLKIFNYQCAFCAGNENEFGELEPCVHSFSSHREAMSKFYFYVLREQDGRFKDGELCLPFYGMIAFLYRNMMAENPPKLENCMPQTRAGALLQDIARSPPSQFLHDCCERGYHSDMLLISSDAKTVIFDTGMVTNFQMAGAHANHVWHPETTWSALHFAFREWQRETGQKYEGTLVDFMFEIQQAHLAMCGVPLVEKMISGRDFIYQRAFRDQEAGWKPTNAPDREVKGLVMGPKPWNQVQAERPAAPVAREVNFSQSFGEEPGSSDSNAFAYVPPHEGSRTMMAASYSTSFRPAGVLDALVRMADEDAQDEFHLPIRLRHQHVDDDVDEEEQDRRAALEDDRAKKRRKAMKALGVFEYGAEEVAEGSESSSGSMEENDSNEI